MRKSVSLKVFYLGFASAALVGLALIWRAVATGSEIEVRRVEESGGDRKAARPGYVLGSDSALLEVVEYSDFACPHCARFTILSMPTIRDRLIRTGLVRWRFWDLPMPFHRNAPIAHRAARCAGEQLQYWQMHDVLFLRQREWSRERRPKGAIRSYARSLGLDLGRFDRCINDPQVAAHVEEARRAAIAIGVTAAPTFRIGHFLVAGAIPYDSLKALVDIALREAEGA